MDGAALCGRFLRSSLVPTVWILWHYEKCNFLSWASASGSEDEQLVDIITSEPLGEGVGRINDVIGNDNDDNDVDDVDGGGGGVDLVELIGKRSILRLETTTNR
eukprot:scaffold13458_cov132-Skeletonema_dohrnii-CCMP3373.AAC.3